MRGISAGLTPALTRPLRGRPLPRAGEASLSDVAELALAASAQARCVPSSERPEPDKLRSVTGFEVPLASHGRFQFPRIAISARPAAGDLDRPYDDARRQRSVPEAAFSPHAWISPAFRCVEVNATADIGIPAAVFEAFASLQDLLSEGLSNTEGQSDAGHSHDFSSGAVQEPDSSYAPCQRAPVFTDSARKPPSPLSPPAPAGRS